MVEVRHQLGSYRVEARTLAEIANFVTEGDAVITDTNLEKAYPEFISRFSMRQVVQPGESSKSLATYERCQSSLIQQGLGRQGSVWAFGGGVVGDLAGFVAATFMRGVKLVQVPTSLLAMVDSSVGGKVGVDLPEGKNLVGSFWPPAAVHLDTGLLATLPRREFINGMAEVWKYGYIMDPGLLESLRRETVSANMPDLQDIVIQCIRDKAAVVQDDEFETTGRRAILNFGHTVGHALEQRLGYENLLHGEAIAIGMVVEAQLAARLGLASEGLSRAIAKDLASQGLPTAIPEGISLPDLVPVLKRDKKAGRNGLAFSFVLNEGECKLCQDVPEEDVRRIWATA